MTPILMLVSTCMNRLVLGVVIQPGQTPYPVNRFLRDLVYNAGANIDGVADSHKTIYGKSGKPLFDMKLVSTPPSIPRFQIFPYYKVDTGNANYQSAPKPSCSRGRELNLPFIEWLKDYFENTRIIEFQNLIGALFRNTYWVYEC